jgi:iron complex outermembrane receptor protein
MGVEVRIGRRARSARASGAAPGLAASLLLAGVGAPALGQAASDAELVVVAPTPLPGAGIDPDKLPVTVQRLTSADFARTGSLSTTDALQQHIAGVSLADTQGNGFTESLDFRGFQASPLQGTPEGIAVYMGGVRLNEAFGDTVNWDLIPETAIRRADLFTGNPAFGLNALGGAATLTMKTGRDSPGVTAEVEGGSFGRIHGSVEAGGASGAWSGYAAVDGGHEDGWRLHSPSSLARGYADLGWTEGPADVHLVLAGAANSFGVVGPTPVDLLRQDRRAVYTFPQTTGNHEGLASLNGKFGLTKHWSLQADAYLRKLNQHHLDGNGGNFEGCSGDPADPLYGTLCVRDDDFPSAIRPPDADFQVLGPSGAAIGCPPLVPGQTRLCDGVPYGTLDKTRTDALGWGGSVQVTSDGAMAGHDNVFALGGSLDHGRVRFSSNSTLGLIHPDLSVGPDPSIPGSGQVIHSAGAIAYSPVELRVSTSYYGLYATDTLDLSRRLSATFSGRLNVARIGMTDLTGTSPDLTGRHSFTSFNPAAGLTYRAVPGLTLYGSYSQANRAPTPLELACSDPLRPCLLENALVADPPLKQVIARTWEAGLRGAPSLGPGRLNWRVSLFRTDNDNDIVALASAIQGRGSYANVPKTRRQGVEASAEFTAASWMAYAAYSHIEATYRFAGDLPSPNSPFADSGGDIQVVAGDHIGGVPADRFKAGVEVEPVPALTLGADVLAVGSQFLVGDEANQDTPLPAYWTADLRASWRINRRLEVYGRIDNLFDRRYATYGTYFETDGLDGVSPSPLPDDPDPRTVTPAAPRSFLIGLRARW